MDPVKPMFSEDLGEKSVVDAVVHISSAAKRKTVHQLLMKPIQIIEKTRAKHGLHEIMDEHV